MANHISENRWADTSDVANRVLTKFVEFGQRVVELDLDLDELWAFHTDDDTEVAKQLHGTNQPTAAQIAMVTDLRAAVQESARVFELRNKGTVRKLTNMGMGMQR